MDTGELIMFLEHDGEEREYLVTFHFQEREEVFLICAICGNARSSDRKYIKKPCNIVCMVDVSTGIPVKEEKILKEAMESIKTSYYNSIILSPGNICNECFNREYNIII